ncbi:hypothetical protein [Streptomyces rimosus]|uniref:hypothetical protein n=1 Tax=Streptomyces rimosus TaxID=1927 RepID=UPI0004C814A4|nr:hypothetical protein [Streptomyces rimosus]
MDNTSLQEWSGDPALYFPDADAAYDACLRYADDAAAVSDRRDPLIRGALRAFKEEGMAGRAVIHRATGIAGTTIDRIQVAGADLPEVTEDHFPDMLLYAHVLDAQADRLRQQAAGKATKAERTNDRTVALALHGIADSVRKVPGPGGDAEIQELAARARRQAAGLRAGTSYLDEGRIQRSGGDSPYAQTVAQHLDVVAAQLTQFRLRGDDAIADLDPDLVAEAERRSKAETTATKNAVLGERYAAAWEEGRYVHGSEEADRTAIRIAGLARRRDELQAEMEQLLDRARREICGGVPQPAESGTADGTDEPLSPGLVRAVAEDEVVRQHLTALLGERDVDEIRAPDDQGA